MRNPLLQKKGRERDNVAQKPLHSRRRNVDSSLINSALVEPSQGSVPSSGSQDVTPTLSSCRNLFEMVVFEQGCRQAETDDCQNIENDGDIHFVQGVTGKILGLI